MHKILLALSTDLFIVLSHKTGCGEWLVLHSPAKICPLSGRSDRPMTTKELEHLPPEAQEIYRQRKEQIANNNQIEDYRVSGGTIKMDFSGKTLELKQFVKTKEALADLISKKDKLKKYVEEIRRNLKFSKIICRFYTGTYVPTHEEQAELIELQVNVFDEVTLQIMESDLSLFIELYAKAKKHKEKLSVLLDITTHPEQLKQLFEQMKAKKPENIRWLYHKLSPNVRQFREAKQLCRELDVPYYVVGCKKRIKVGDYESLDVSSLLKAFFDCAGCALDYSPARERKGKPGFSKTMSVFNIETWEWQEEKNRNYRSNRTFCYEEMDKVQAKPSEIKARPKIQKILGLLNKM